MGLFDKLESKLEQGVNGAFARAFRAEVQPVEIAAGVRRAMDDRAAAVKKGKRPIVPNLFTVELSDADYERLCAMGRDLDDELIAAAQEHADEQRYLPGGPVTIVLSNDSTLETGVFHLRPATASASESQAVAQAHPRPYVNMGYDADPAPTNERPGWGSRIKGYLSGTDSTPASRDEVAENHAYAEDGYDYPDHVAPAYEYSDRAPHAYDEPGAYSGSGSSATSLGSAFSAADSSRTNGPAQQSAPAAYPGGFTPSKRHAWDDDDDDLHDATGLHEPAPGPDNTATFQSPSPAAPRQESPRMRPWLKIDGQRYPLLSAITVVGRDEDADIIIDDPGVSRRHSEIRITHDGPRLVMSIRDLGSTNGTFVNGEQIESEHVYDGDALTIGRTRMSIHLGDRS